MWPSREDVPHTSTNILYVEPMQLPLKLVIVREYITVLCVTIHPPKPTQPTIIGGMGNCVPAKMR